MNINKILVTRPKVKGIPEIMLWNTHMRVVVKTPLKGV